MSNSNLNEIINKYEIQLAEMIKRLNELNIKEKELREKEKANKSSLFVEITKEEINKRKTAKQIEVEKNSPLFLRNKIPDNKLFHPYRTGYKIKEKRYTDMFNYVWIEIEGRKEGKVKYTNECLNLDKYKNTETKKSSISQLEKVHNNKKQETNGIDIKKDKVYIALQKKKINDLKIVARDLKMKGYTIMQKEELVKKIFEIVKQKEKEKEEKKELGEISKQNEKNKMTKSELLKSCEIEEESENNDDNNEENEHDNEYNDDDINESDEIDYN